MEKVYAKNLSCRFVFLGCDNIDREGDKIELTDNCNNFFLSSNLLTLYKERI